MAKLKLEIHENPFVVLFTVYVDAIGLLQQSVFKHEKAGVFTYEQEITFDKPSLVVRFTIVGQGSDTQTPKGICLVFLDGSQLNPYLAAAITAGNSAKSVEYVYVLDSTMASTDVHYFHPLLSPGTPVKAPKRAKPAPK